jgi:adenylate kinase family enzyme
MSEEKEIKESPVNTPTQTRKKSRWKLILLGLVILFCGMVIGAGITFHAGNVMMFRAISQNGEMAERVTKHIDRDLDLTDEQRFQVAKIVAHRISVFKNILIDDAYPRIKEQFELLHGEVASILTEEQKIKWEKHYEKMQKVIIRIHKRLLPDRK